MKHAITIFCAAWALAGCSTVPDLKDRAASPYIVSNIHNSYVNFSHDIKNADDRIQSVELWHMNTFVANGKIMQFKDGVMRVAYLVRFSWRAGEETRIRILTRDKQVHEFEVGDPWSDDGQEFSGTMYPL